MKKITSYILEIIQVGLGLHDSKKWSVFNLDHVNSSAWQIEMSFDLVEASILSTMPSAKLVRKLSIDVD